MTKLARRNINCASSLFPTRDPLLQVLCCHQIARPRHRLQSIAVYIVRNYFGSPVFAFCDQIVRKADDMRLWVFSHLRSIHFVVLSERQCDGDSPRARSAAGEGGTTTLVAAIPA